MMHPGRYFTRFVFLVLTCILTTGIGYAQDYTIEQLDSGPDTDELSQELKDALAPTGYAIRRGGTRTVAEIWFLKELPLSADFTPSPQRLYGLEPTQLVGVVHFPRRWSDFRDQPISRGWYTLRFQLQPIDGNHVGTSPTRDFLLLINAEDDSLDRKWEPDELNEAAAEVAESSHPALICLQPPSDEPEASVRHDDLNDWWIVHLFADGVKNREKTRQPIDLVIEGHGPE